MKINTALLLLVPFVLLRGCVSAPPAPVQMPPAPPPRPRYVPPQAPLAPAPMTKPSSSTWRDAPQTPGAWTYATQAGGSTVRFGMAGGLPLVTMRCDRARSAVVIERQSLGSGTLPATITTSSGARRLSAVPVSGAPAAQNAPLAFEIALAVRDPLLDGMAFSRGRFMLEMAGAPTLYLPAWAEIGRVTEDCR